MILQLITLNTLFVTAIITHGSLWGVCLMLLAPIPVLVRKQREWDAYDRLNGRWQRN
jgi:hypothetical protein